MIKFIHKKHINKVPHTSKFVVYYSVTDIILGILLLVFVVFFIANYWQSQKNTSILSEDSISNTHVNTMPVLHAIKK